MSKNLPYNRSERVGDGIYRVISQAIVMELSDPRLDGVAITRVNMTPDLRTARVYFFVEAGSGKGKDEVYKGLSSASGYLKRLIAKSIVLKFMPEIEFFYDESIELSEKIDKLFVRISEGSPDE